MALPGVSLQVLPNSRLEGKQPEKAHGEDRASLASTGGEFHQMACGVPDEPNDASVRVAGTGRQKRVGGEPLRWGGSQAFCGFWRKGVDPFVRIN
jgi:hypothetical protein